MALPQVTESTNSLFKNQGFDQIKSGEQYFTSQLLERVDRTGDIRISWMKVPCEEITVIAQQIQNDDGIYTMRQWNPTKVDVAYGDNNDSSTDASCPITCICCFVVEKLFKSVF